MSHLTIISARKVLNTVRNKASKKKKKQWVTQKLHLLWITFWWTIIWVSWKF